MGFANARTLPQPIHRDNRFVSRPTLWFSAHCTAGVITYSTNLNTSEVVRQMVTHTCKDSEPAHLRILLETDAPFMVPGNIYSSMPEMKGRRLPLSHSAMIPWTAEFVAQVANEAGGSWDTESVMRCARDNAKRMYGV